MFFKTIQNEIKDINKQLRNGKILSIRGVGYKLEGSFDEVNLNSNLYDDVDRVEYIIRKILTLSNEEKNTIKLEDLADSMYVSVSTVKNDLKEVKEYWKSIQYQLNLSINKVYVFWKVKIRY